MRATPLIALGMILVAVFGYGLVQRLDQPAIAYLCSPECGAEDLAAQQSMAAAAWAMFWATLASLGVGAISVVMLVLTLRASIENNQISRRNGEAATRAYVDLASARVSIEQHDGVGYGDHPTLRLTFANTGNSPGSDLRYSFQTKYFYPGSAEDVRGSAELPAPSWGKPIRAGGEVTVTHHLLPSFLAAADREAFVGGALHLLVTMRMSYRDVFDIELSSEHNLIAQLPAQIASQVAMSRWPHGVHWPP